MVIGLKQGGWTAPNKLVRLIRPARLFCYCSFFGDEENRSDDAFDGVIAIEAFLVRLPGAEGAPP
jgi:hypothetical protein